MTSKYAKEKFSFKLNLIEIMAVLSFLFMIFALTLSITTEDPKEFIVESVKNITNTEENKVNEGPRFEFGGEGSAPVSPRSIAPKVIFAGEKSREYQRGMQELVDQGLLSQIPKSSDDSYFYFEDLKRDQKVFIARLDTKGEEENCITSNTEYNCIFYTEEELVIFYTKEGTEEKEVVFDNREEI